MSIAVPEHKKEHVNCIDTQLGTHSVMQHTANTVDVFVFVLNTNSTKRITSTKTEMRAQIHAVPK
jgi:hypothetical protein